MKLEAILDRLFDHKGIFVAWNQFWKDNKCE